MQITCIIPKCTRNERNFLDCISAARSRDQHVIVIVLTRPAPTDSRFVRKLVHTLHYPATPKLRQMPPKTLNGGRYTFFLLCLYAADEQCTRRPYANICYKVVDGEIPEDNRRNCTWSSLKLEFRKYPAIHTNYMISPSTTLQYNKNI